MSLIEPSRIPDPFMIYLISTHKNRQPCLELRRATTDPQAIKTIISCAYKKQPLIIQPVFRDEIRATAQLIEKGIIYEEEGQYFYTI